MALGYATASKETNPQPQSFVVEGCDTLAKVFRRKCLERGDRVALREKNLGIWQSFSWMQYYENARRVGRALLALGLRPGEVVAILSEDNKEWVFCDLGIQGAGGKVHGVYPTLKSTQLAFQLSDSGARVLFVEDEEQLDKFLEIESSLPNLETVVVFDMEGLRKFRHRKVKSWDDFLSLADAQADALDIEWDRRIDAGEQEDIATLIYTSGTTGLPKGSCISNRYLLVQADQYPRMPVGPGDELLTFLPLCHAAERIFSVASAIGHGVTINFAESGETFAQDLQEVAPTIIFAVPRVWEKFYSRINIIMNDATAFGRVFYRAALAVSRKRLGRIAGKKRVPIWLELAHKGLDWAVLRNIRVMLGLNNAHTIISGAAPISPNMLNWFNQIGLSVREAYGQTETGIVTLTEPGVSPVGSVGRGLKDAEIRIAEDGEILIRWPGNFSGYLNAPEKTAETIVEGWVHTGDLGRMDQNGNLFILDRKKDIIITAGGKNITPSLVENELKFSPYISDAIIIGDRRPYLVALVMIDHENVEKFAQDRRIPFTDFRSLCESEKVVELISEEVNRVNSGFSPVEQVKRVRLIDILLTPEDDELTPTMKLKRKEVERKYFPIIEDMYRR
jgi:long-chain acyl-CoA synthetase